ncbi:putative ATPase [Lutibacter sp. Hel_I_33_5]|uniref:AAA family ATPase n=1 Tax=Lutibacter sp. Hel_I_33_5 TaxID=1566289 RepID=UPI0011A0DDA1|nr:ATP-binding protein [Lutibacter sp. Hel_I_33_5]TVZ57238.1 putative ATPase [Lutibacter sp. Hel_I_33_5]
MQQKIVLIGGPGTGKSTVLNELKLRGFFCMEEISREVTLKAQKEGIDQLFLSQPLLFSELLLKGREQQFLTADSQKENIVFFDRGLPDVYAYLEYLTTDFPSFFKEKCLQYKYTHVFLFKPWQEIYTSDNERYETFEESVIIDSFLQKAYKENGYKIINVPFGSLENRVDFIINSLSL